MLALKSGLRFFVSASEVPFFGTWKWALSARVELFELRTFYQSLPYTLLWFHVDLVAFFYRVQSRTATFSFLLSTVANVRSVTRKTTTDAFSDNLLPIYSVKFGTWRQGEKKEVYVYTELKHDPCASLPGSFTVCSTIMTTGYPSYHWPNSWVRPLLTLFNVLTDQALQIRVNAILYLSFCPDLQ